MLKLILNFFNMYILNTFFFTLKVAIEPISITYIYYGLPAKCKIYVDI